MEFIQVKQGDDWVLAYAWLDSQTDNPEWSGIQFVWDKDSVSTFMWAPVGHWRYYPYDYTKGKK